MNYSGFGATKARQGPDLEITGFNSLTRSQILDIMPTNYDLGGATGAR